jgi:endonuclease/exonuclease/phosphatase family metal-dependent hydrolase
MNILQLNVWGGRLEKQILNLLKEVQPDIVCLQEAISLKGKNGGFFLNVEEMAEELGMHLSFSPVLGFNFMNRKAKFGNAILSKIPFSSENTVFTRKEFVEDFDFDSTDYNVRNLQHISIGQGEATIHVLNHHGHHINAHKNGDEETMRQCKVIADYADKLDGRVVLAGDFNLSPLSQSLAQINSVLLNLSTQHNLQTTRTELTHKREVCDYIFVSKEVNVKDFQALDDIVSDHKGLLLEIVD